MVDSQHQRDYNVKPPIVLLRGRDLVKQLEVLVPSVAGLIASGDERDQHRNDAIALLTSLARQCSTSKPVIVPSTNAVSPSSTSDSDRSSSIKQITTVRRTRGHAAPSSGKRCHIPDCDKIAVSRGLCRGHGGGRRCQQPGCSKSAQSRSEFCWSHGGGQRCAVDGCMRSRKSKQFCVTHMNPSLSPTEEKVPSGHHTQNTIEPVKLVLPRSFVPIPNKLPSLSQALRKHQQYSY